MRRFPTLEMLDKEPVTKISFDAPQTPHPVGSSDSRSTAKDFPAPMQTPLIAGVDGSLITSFFARYASSHLPVGFLFHDLVSFFPLFDTQRPMLSNAYNEFATFSFQANTSIPARAKIQGFQHSKEMPNQRHLEWSPWLGAGSRNLSRVAGVVDKVLKSIHVGRENTLKAMSSLPQTKHDIVGAAEKFCIDAWPVTHEDRTTLFLSIHGQLIEGLSLPPETYIPDAKLWTCSTSWRGSIIRSIIYFDSGAGRVEVRPNIWNPTNANCCHAANQGESEWVGRRNTVRSTCDPCLFQPRSMESWTSSCTGGPI